MMTHNVVLVGMAGVGKSTLGVLLTKELRKAFVDTDLLLTTALGVSLQVYLDTHGYQALRQAEEKAICAMDCSHTVISTGGSAVYSVAAMNYLRASGPIVYLRAPLELIVGRMDNMATRGIAAPPGMTLEDIYAEREPLYAAAADIVVDATGSVDETLGRLLALLPPVKPLQ